MSRIILKIILCIAVLFVAALPVYAQQAKLGADIEFIEKKITRMSNYAGDFLDFVNPQRGNFEGRVQTAELFHSAVRFDELLNSLATLLVIYNKLACQSDKVAISPLVESDVRGCAKKIGTTLASINDLLAAIKTPAIVVVGTQFKDDLRETRARLEAIRLN